MRSAWMGRVRSDQHRGERRATSEPGGIAPAVPLNSELAFDARIEFEGHETDSG